METAGFTQEEMALFNLAKSNSDVLVDIENIASNAMVGLYRPNNTTGLTEKEALAFTRSDTPNASYAAQLVHGVEYHKAKAQIMRPIDEFTAKATNRVLKRIDDTYRLSVVVIALLATMLGLLIILLLIYFCKVQGDTQTAALLTTMLPNRVVESVSVDHFTQLRQAASTRIDRIALDRRMRRMRQLTAARIASKGSVSEAFPVLYSEFLPMAWVAFTDVVDFTSMCRYTPAKRVIGVLNELFSLLDVEALNFGVEKIKTIGDAFMCAKLTTSELHAPTDEITRMKRVSDDGFIMVRFLLRAIRLARNVVRPMPLTVVGARRAPQRQRNGSRRPQSPRLPSRTPPLEGRTLRNSVNFRIRWPMVIVVFAAIRRASFQGFAHLPSPPLMRTTRVTCVCASDCTSGRSQVALWASSAPCTISLVIQSTPPRASSPAVARTAFK
jgi:hypothetical protein